VNTVEASVRLEPNPNPNSHVNLVSAPLDRQVSTVEASLRLDSVASAGMGMSRSKMSAAIKSGLVLVNWKAATSGTTDVRMRTLLPLS